MFWVQTRQKLENWQRKLNKREENVNPISESFGKFGQENITMKETGIGRYFEDEPWWHYIKGNKAARNGRASDDLSSVRSLKKANLHCQE